MLRSFLIFYDVRHRRLTAVVAACRFSEKQLNVPGFIFGSLNLIFVPLRERERKTGEREREKNCRKGERRRNGTSNHSSETNLLFLTAFVLPMVFLSHVNLPVERMLMSTNATCPINCTIYISHRRNILHVSLYKIHTYERFNS